MSGIVQPGTYLRVVLSVAVTLWLLVEARPVLEPLMIAILLWFLLTAVANGFARLAGGPRARPGPVARALSGASVVIAIALLTVITARSVAGFRENLPAYEANLKAMIDALTGALGLQGELGLSRLLESVSVSDLLLGVAGNALGVVSSLVIIIVYVIFIFAETRAYPAKLAALAPDPGRRARLAGMIERIHGDVEAYIGVKCVIGLAQAAPTWALLWAVGLDGAGFWAVIVFLFSFIPTVGSLVGIIFPSIVALAQFSDPVLIVGTLVSMAAIQLVGSNWLEPHLMGQRLNLSPLVILVAIFAGGAVWGIVGALVAVPALAVALIVFAGIEQMRPVAVLLSSDGRIPESFLHREAAGGEEPAGRP